MTASEIAAYIGAAAWLPIVLGWFYKLCVRPQITIIPDESPEIGFSTFGPIVNLRMAISGARKPAIIDSITLILTHQNGESATFHWSGMTEQVNQIVDESRATRQRIEKETDPIAFLVGVESVVVKLVKFQNRSFHQEMQPLVNVAVEKVHFSQKQNSFSHMEASKWPEFEAIKRGWLRLFPWKTGKYTAKFSVSSPHRINLKQIPIQFDLTDTDIEILRKNLEINEQYAIALMKSAEDATPLPTFAWNWRYPKTVKIR